MSTVELHTYRFACDEFGRCNENRTITIQATDEYVAAAEAQKQGWLVQPPDFEGDEDYALCPEHFAASVPLWRNVDYNPHWLNTHPSVVGGLV